MSTTYGPYNATVSTVRNCERCGKHGAVLAERLDKNLRPVKQLLCTPCRRKHGYRDVKFDRSPPSTWGTAPL